MADAREPQTAPPTGWQRFGRLCVMILVCAGVRHYTGDGAWYVHFTLFLVAAAITEWAYLGRLDLR